MRNLAMLTDLYEFTMSNGYDAVSQDKQGVFDVFFRKIPDNGSFIINAGLQQVVNAVQDFHFNDDDLTYLQSLAIFSDDFIDYLRNFHFDCQITAIPEGTPVFPREPIMSVRGPLIQTQLIETLVLNMLNHQSLIATKARRITFAAQNKPVMEFGARRAQGPDSAIYGARAAVIGGCASTSNVFAAKEFAIPAAGTMAHAWVESFPNELIAFQKWAEIYPDNASFLVDTYDVLQSGVPNAITVFQQLQQAGYNVQGGIRIDSGDIAQLTKQARQMLDDAGLQQIKITVSNALDEQVIQSLLQEGAPIDSFGVGEKLITSASSPVLSGVYKLAAIIDDGQLIPKIKVSANRDKLTLPGVKKTYRLYNSKTKKAFADVIALNEENLQAPLQVIDSNPLSTTSQTTLNDFEAVALSQIVMEQGQSVTELPEVLQIQSYCKTKLAELPTATLRIVNPDAYPVYITQKLADLQNKLIKQHLQ
ncbi:nicotinate phosphoribosyltransferase [Bombilactobacillus thymidiniphilus]|uniref:Nicotinate phosphoribosyltransferase n=1 Tax=Bombilactobacillus thymidiniphilus TaxID=2923363 RepID=A0ABY4PF67_9LACO|nr:nicotinate phosphoribosyltransferase [Bombilactobacillus thymidiniphilus]UQS84242.1 nicotinate phosphoribosyltransferase [Bombilactobacillus thymidiniphilus]